jgi:hypothetical protein
MSLNEIWINLTSLKFVLSSIELLYGLILKIYIKLKFNHYICAREKE